MAGNGNGGNGKHGHVPFLSLESLQKPVGIVGVRINGESRELTVYDLGGIPLRDIKYQSELVEADPSLSRVPLIDAGYRAVATCTEGATPEELGTLPETVISKILAVAMSNIETVAAMLAAENERTNPPTAAAGTRKARGSSRRTGSDT